MAVCLIVATKSHIGSKSDMDSLIGLFVLQDDANQSSSIVGTNSQLTQCSIISAFQKDVQFFRFFAPNILQDPVFYFYLQRFF